MLFYANRVKQTSSKRPEVDSDPELKALAKLSIGQLTDAQLQLIYKPEMTYLSDNSESADCSGCDLCKKAD